MDQKFREIIAIDACNFILKLSTKNRKIHIIPESKILQNFTEEFLQYVKRVDLIDSESTEIDNVFVLRASPLTFDLIEAESYVLNVIDMFLSNPNVLSHQLIRSTIEANCNPNTDQLSFAVMIYIGLWTNAVKRCTNYIPTHATLQ